MDGLSHYPLVVLLFYIVLSQMWSENIMLDVHKNKVLTFYIKLHWVFLRPNKVNIIAIKISKVAYHTFLAFCMSLGLLHSPLPQTPLVFLFSLSLPSLARHKKWNQKVPILLYRTIYFYFCLFHKINLMMSLESLKIWEAKNSDMNDDGMYKGLAISN